MKNEKKEAVDKLIIKWRELVSSLYEIEDRTKIKFSEELSKTCHEIGNSLCILQYLVNDDNIKEDK